MKFKKIAITIIALTILGCTSNQVVKDDIYTTKNITYNVITNKPVNGVVVKELNGYKEYYTYEKGKLKNYKSVDQNANLIQEKKYDSMGLLNGKIKDREDFTIYRHGILSGEKQNKNYGDSRESFKDGTLHGKSKVNGEIKYYENGVESKGEVIEVKSLEKKVRWGTDLKNKNYTGEIYSEPILKELIPNYTATLEVKGYEKGILKYAKYYTTEGFKIKEYVFYEGDINKISKTLEFRNGFLIKSSEYNLKGELDGVVKERNWQLFKIKNYNNGILQGETTEYVLPSNNAKKDKVYRAGSYTLGVFTGKRDGRYYVDGVQVYEKNEMNYTTQNINVDVNPVVDKNSGLFKRTEEKNILIDHYVEGKIEKTYFFNKENLDKVTTYIENGRYIEEIYRDGILKSRYTYNSKGVKDGQAVLVEHEDSRSEGNIVLGEIVGEMKHYHENKVYYIDNYKDEYNHRTIYYDYEKNKIENTTSRIKDNKTSQWILVGEAYAYYKSGAIKAKVDYGKARSYDKNVKYIEYYESGVIKSKYIQDYHAWKLIGERINYQENGKIKEKLVYSENGYLVNKKEYNEKGKLAKESSYDEYGRVLEI